MQYDIPYRIEHAPAFGSLVLNIPARRTVLVEASAMAAMDTSIKMKSKIKGGLLKGVGRMLSGESLFINEFTAQERGGELYISPNLPGDIRHYYLKVFLAANLCFYCGLQEKEIFGLVLMAELWRFLLKVII